MRSPRRKIPPPASTCWAKSLTARAEAKAFTDYYRQQLQSIRQKTATITPKANVFVEALAGNSDACCFTHGHSGWGGLVEAVGANNIGSQLLPGASGFVSLEKIISMKPDASDHDRLEARQQPVLPLGYAVKPEAVKARGADAAGAASGSARSRRYRKSGPMAFITTSITTRGILSAWNTRRKISTRRPSAISTRMRRTIISCAISPTCRTNRSSSPRQQSE